MAAAELWSDSSLFLYTLQCWAFQMQQNTVVSLKTTTKMSCQVLHDAEHKDESSWGPCRDPALEQGQRAPGRPAWEAPIPLETSVSHGQVQC